VLPSMRPHSSTPSQVPSPIPMPPLPPQFLFLGSHSPHSTRRDRPRSGEGVLSRRPCTSQCHQHAPGQCARPRQAAHRELVPWAHSPSLTRKKKKRKIGVHKRRRERASTCDNSWGGSPTHSHYIEHQVAGTKASRLSICHTPQGPSAAQSCQQHGALK